MYQSGSRKPGITLFVGTVQFALAIVLAESYYPNYNVSTNYISDLAATCRKTCEVFQPSATIINTSAILLGLLLLATAYYLRNAFGGVVAPALFALAGAGALGSGLFPETAGVVHTISSFVAFLLSGLAAFGAYRLQKPPMSFSSVLAGLFTLTALALITQGVYLGLGVGGMARMVVYPVLLWGIGFGGYPMSERSSW